MVHSPHGPQCQAVGQLGVIGQHGREEVAGKSVHGDTLAEHDLPEATEGAPWEKQAGGGLKEVESHKLSQHRRPDYSPVEKRRRGE